MAKNSRKKTVRPTQASVPQITGVGAFGQYRLDNSRAALAEAFLELVGVDTRPERVRELVDSGQSRSTTSR